MILLTEQVEGRRRKYFLGPFVLGARAKYFLQRTISVENLFEKP